MKLFNCTCQKNSSQVLKGMNVEVITSAGTPKSDEIKKAVERKYDVSLSNLSIITFHWDCSLLS